METLSVPPLFDSPVLMDITPRPAAVMARGAGSYLWDEAGNRYLDLIQGWAVNCLGHCPPEISQALQYQSQQLISPSPALHNRPQLKLAERLVALSGFKNVHFANSGAEANEAAVKLARKWGRLHKKGAYKVITTTQAFHGRTLAMMAASGKAGWEELFPPYPEGFSKVPFGCEQSMAAAIDKDTVAIMVEPIQGEAGVVVPPTGYLQALRELADQHNLLLIFDEVQTGIGRTGALFGFQRLNVVPDVMTLGKGLGGGVPLSAVLANPRASCFEYGDQGGTYNGNPLIAAVGLAVLDVVACPSFLNQVLAREEALRNGLQQLATRFGCPEYRGMGLLYALVLPGNCAETIRDQAFDLGLLINPARPNVLRFMPSLRISTDEIDAALNLLEECLAKVVGRQRTN
jgi:acetylornithine/N-succinyldiaminopimelate aminotransferase